MIGALLGGAASLLGGGGGGLFGGSSEPAGPENITQTVTTGAINLGNKNLGRGSVTSAETTAQGSGSISTPAQNNTPLYVGAGVAVLLVVLLSLRGK